MWHPETPLEYRSQIVTGDARVLAERIPDESIDLIFTDPPYPQKFIPLYGWLAETASRVLKQGGLCLAMAGQSYLPQIYTLMGVNLTYHWTFNMNTPGKACTLWNRRVNSNWKPILSYLKGDKYDGPMFGTDALTSAGSDKNFHHWGQSVSSAFWFIERLQGIVFEPFAGGGTVPAVCKMLGRDYIAFEMDEAVAETARERVRKTPFPLIVAQTEQLSLV